MPGHATWLPAGSLQETESGTLPPTATDTEEGKTAQEAGLELLPVAAKLTEARLKSTMIANTVEFLIRITSRIDFHLAVYKTDRYRKVAAGRKPVYAPSKK